ncbi:peptidase U34 [Loigolactobacillus backii]|uniref:C69 family dipeptidase n=1 Tax=Loigolactobacillus backii TaxID=375175 RepID=UPI0007F0F6D6|nr:C69 family dipeptidase [Loigolactobacillus backii]ANK59412.1 peptidase U34 [Loigolactobacillus backii]ANK64406.1 peptidase U34 [Loigolactobacillus backii]ANK67200.1 peptidase U34 [Loigolactobacillus backii]OLF69435.1 peptidase U34 [Loigolactobacillus backii]PIO87844.1 dipeptidase [Loigolactobacillus backii]
MQKNLLTNFSACTSVLVGKAASADGSTFIGRNEDSKAAWPKHFVKHAHNSAGTEFVSKDTGLSLTLPQESAAYTATPEWTDKFGLFEEDGINEYGVAMSATESAYANAQVLGYDPLVAGGIAEEAMVTVVLPYVHSAREGVQRLGDLISQSGTSETNGILFSDQEEVWYLESGSGHHWVAQRIPDDSYAVVSNQLSIQVVDFADTANFMSSPAIQAFASQHHLWRTGTPFNFREIFGTQSQSDLIYNTPRVWYGQRLLNPSSKQKPMSFTLPFVRQAEQPITVEMLSQILSSHFQGTKYDPVGQGKPKNKHKFRPISLAKTQESHILQLRPNLPTAIGGLHWLAMGVAAESCYVPFYAGISETPADYKVGGATYDPQSNYWAYKLLGVLVDSHYHEFNEQLAAVQNKVHANLLHQLEEADQKAVTLTGTALTDYLTKTSAQRGAYARQEFETLTAKLITQATDRSPLNFNTDANL